MEVGRSAVLLAALSLWAAASASAQDVLIVNGRYRSAIRAFGQDLGAAPAEWWWTTVGGGRYLLDGNVLFDTASGTRRFVSPAMRIVAVDPVRPRLFVRVPGTLFSVIAAYDIASGAVRPLTTVSGAEVPGPEQVRYAYSADRLFLDVTDRDAGGPASPHVIRVIDGTTGAEAPSFTVTAGATTSGASWTVAQDGATAYVGYMVNPFAGPAVVTAVDVPTGGQTSAQLPRVSGLMWDETNERVLADGGNTVTVFTRGLTPLASGPIEGTHSIHISPHTGRMYIAAGQFHGIYGGDLHLAVFDSRTFQPLGAFTQPDGSARLNVFTAPGPPRALAAAVTGHDVALSWTNVGAASGFVLDVGLAPGRTDLSVYLGPDPHTSFSGVPSGTYYLRLRGGNLIGGGRPSQEIQLVVP